MAQDGVFGQHSGPKLTAPRDHLVADRVDTVMVAVQQAARTAGIDGASAEAERLQLTARDDSVLQSRQFSDRLVGCAPKFI